MQTAQVEKTHPRRFIQLARARPRYTKAAHPARPLGVGLGLGATHRAAGGWVMGGRMADRQHVGKWKVDQRSVDLLKQTPSCGIMMTMTGMTELERTAIIAVLEEAQVRHTAFESELLNASVVARKNTGGGFYTDLEIQGTIPKRFEHRHLGSEIWVTVPGLEHGLGMILHLREGKEVLLEGYAVGPEDTSPINFERAHFALASKPGPLAGDTSTNPAPSPRA